MSRIGINARCRAPREMIAQVLPGWLGAAELVRCSSCFQACLRPPVRFPCSIYFVSTRCWPTSREKPQSQELRDAN